jgi:hypothetical protein
MVLSNNKHKLFNAMAKSSVFKPVQCLENPVLGSLGFIPPLFLLLKKVFFFLENFRHSLRKKLGIIFHFFCFSGANLTNFSNFLVNFRKKKIHPKTEKKNSTV